jgi:hypothetical protein
MHTSSSRFSLDGGEEQAVVDQGVDVRRVGVQGKFVKALCSRLVRVYLNARNSVKKSGMLLEFIKHFAGSGPSSGSHHMTQYSVVDSSFFFFFFFL